MGVTVIREDRSFWATSSGGAPAASRRAHSGTPSLKTVGRRSTLPTEHLDTAVQTESTTRGACLATLFFGMGVAHDDDRGPRLRNTAGPRPYRGYATALRTVLGGLVRVLDAFT